MVGGCKRKLNEKKKKPKPTVSLTEFNLLADLESQEGQLRSGATNEGPNQNVQSSSRNIPAATDRHLFPRDTSSSTLEINRPRSSVTIDPPTSQGQHSGGDFFVRQFGYYYIKHLYF